MAEPSPVISALMLSRRQSASDRPAPYCAYCASSWNTSPADRVRVEVVVEVDGVDVVLRDRVHDRGLAVLPGLRDARVVVELAAVGDGPLGVELRRVRGREAGDVGREVHGDPVGVEPGVELEVAAVGLGDREGQRVVAGVAALGAGEVLRPRLQGRRPERVGGRANLHDDGVVALRDGQVVVPDELGLLRGGGEAGSARPVDVGHRRDPDPPQVGLVGVRVQHAGRAARQRAQAGGVRSGGGPGQGESGGGSAEDGTTGRLHDSSTLRQSGANKLRGRDNAVQPPVPYAGRVSPCRRRTSSAPGPRRPRPRRCRPGRIPPRSRTRRRPRARR